MAGYGQRWLYLSYALGVLYANIVPHMSAHTKDNHYELFSRSSEEGRKSWEQECLDTIDHLYNVPSIAVWVPFNEGWGQFDAARIAKMVAKRPHPSGRPCQRLV